MGEHKADWPLDTKAAIAVVKNALESRDQRIAALEAEVEGKDLQLDEWAATARERLLRVAALEGFAKSVIKLGWSGEQVDSGDIQEFALAVGLIREVPGGYDPAKHGDDAFCDPGDQYYELTIGGEVDGG